MLKLRNYISFLPLLPYTLFKPSKRKCYFQSDLKGFGRVNNKKKIC